MFCNTPLKIAERNDILMSVRTPVGPSNIADRECCIGRGLIEKFNASLGSGSTFHAINKSQLASVEVNIHGFDLAEQWGLRRCWGWCSGRWSGLRA